MIKVPENAAYLINKLTEAGFEAYAVGGCVRDSLSGRTPNDWDITTSALPEEVLSVLGKHNVIESGMKHGTVTVKQGGELFEITTFRTDGEYLDNRRPESVTFVKSLKEDLSRRDFTINAMAYNDMDGLQDYFGGESDLSAGVIRCVGEADLRFGEDALRILRALRFASRLGFNIEPQTAASIHRNAALLNNISAERICAELLQIIDGEYAENVLIEYSDVIRTVIPEIGAMIGLEQYNPHHIFDVWEHTIRVIVNSPHGKVMRLAALLHDVGKPQCFSLDSNGVGHFHGHPKVSADMAGVIMRRLRLDNKTISRVVTIIEFHDYRPTPDAKSVRRLLSKIGADAYTDLMALKRADVLGQNPATFNEKLAYIEELERIFREQTRNGEEYSLRTLNIKGSDLIALGVKDGREIGKTLNALLSMVIDGEIENDRDELIKRAEGIIKVKS